MGKTLNYTDVDTSLNLQRRVVLFDSATGKIFNASIDDIRDLMQIVSNSSYAGPASTTTDPGTPETTVWYIATGIGTYTNFTDNTDTPLQVVDGDGFVLFSYNVTGGYWVKQSVPINLTNYYNKTQADGRYTQGGTQVIAGNNLFDKTNTVDDQSIVASDGHTSPQTGWRYAHISIPVGATNLTVSGVNLGSKNYRFMNASNVLISGQFGTLATSTQTFTIPAGAAFFDINVKRDNEATSVMDTVMINTGSTALAYESYSFETLMEKLNTLSIIAKRVKTGAKNEAGKTLATTDQIPMVILSTEPVSPKNLFNKATAAIGFNITPGTGALTANATYDTSDYIPVVAGSYFGKDSVSNLATRNIAFYNSSQVLVTPGIVGPVSSITIPSGVAFIRITVYHSSLNTYQLEAGTVQTPFAAYFAPYNRLLGLNSAKIDIPIPDYTATTIKKVSLKNVERINFFGDSYTDGVHSLRGKAYVALISLFTDWNIENYSKSGDDYPDIHARILSNEAWLHPTVGVKNYSGGGYGVLISYQNDTDYIVAGDKLTSYIANLKQVANDIKSLGYKPVIATEHQNTTSVSQMLVSALSQLAQEQGYEFIDVLTRNLTYRGTNVGEYWYGSHPGTRINSLLWWPMLRAIRTFPRPKASIKIFRKRSTFSPSGINSFLFADRIDRNKSVKEIFVTQGSLQTGSEKYFDELNTLNTLQSGGAPPRTNVAEYLNLIAGTAVSFADYALVEMIVDSNASALTYFALGLSDSSLSVYVKDWQNNAWVSVTSLTTNGETLFPLADLQSQVQYDKVVFLLYKSGGFSLTDIYYKWDGKQGKDYGQRKPIVDLTTTEMLSNPLLTTLTNWTVNGSITPAAPADGNKPSGITNKVDLTTVNTISQTVTFNPSGGRSRKVQVKGVARINPARFNSSGTYPTGAAITDDTYDLGLLQVEVSSDSSNIIVFQEVVTLHWTDALFEFMLPTDATVITFTFKSGDSKTIEFTNASVKIEN